MSTTSPLSRHVSALAATLLIAVLAGVSVSARAESKPGEFSREEARQYLRFQQRLTQGKVDFYDQLIKKYPGKEVFTAYELTAITAEKVKQPIEDQDEKPVQKLPALKGSITPQAAREHLALAERSKLGDEALWNALKAKYGEQDWYTQKQVNDIISPPPPPPKPPMPVQKGTPPAGAITADDALAKLAAVEKERLGKEALWADLQKKFGAQDYYLPSQIREAEDNTGKPQTEMNYRKLPDLVEDARLDQTAPHSTFAQGFDGLLIRQNSHDLLFEEDPSLGDAAKGTLGDLSGATASYTHNGKTSRDSWSAIGALIVPWHFNPSQELLKAAPFLPSKFALAPSASINKTGGNADPKMNSDSVLYRLGLYGDWNFTGKDQSPLGFQIRAAGVYATDTGGNARLPGYEVDFEPRTINPLFRLGYKYIAISKAPYKADGSDTSFLDLQLRAWLHFEGGDVQDTGATWDPTHGSFQRYGPSVQFQLNMPELAWHRDLSFTALYTNLTAISGSDVHDSYFKATLTFDLLKDSDAGHKVVFNATYQKGGLSFTKEEVDTFTVGLGVLF